MNSASEFPKRLRARMDKLGLSQSDLAAEMWGRRINAAGKNDAIGKDRISVWIRGLNFPDPKNLKRLADNLEMEVSELTGFVSLPAVSELTLKSIDAKLDLILRKLSQ